MGGSGSGSGPRPGAKPSIDDFYHLDIRHCARRGMLLPGQSTHWRWKPDGKELASIHVTVEADRIVLNYRHCSDEGSWKTESYPVRIVRTDCHFGGSRQWFLCPTSDCGRRVAVLYGDTLFACRECHRLAYSTTREDAGARAARRAEKIRAHMGWSSDEQEWLGQKPKWMRWATFDRLQYEYQFAVMQSLAALAERVARTRAVER